MVRPLVEFAHWLSPCNCHARSNSLNTANSLSSGPLNFLLTSTMTKKNNKKSRYFRFSPNFAHRKLIDLAKYVLSSSFREVLSFTQRFFQKASPLGIYLSRFLRRMKACIDEFQPNTANTSQANYFEGFWRITSKTNTKMEITKQ